MTRQRVRAVTVALALGASATLAACEGTIEWQVDRTIAPHPVPVTSSDLRALARAHSQEMCDAGAVMPSADPVATYGPLSLELVAAAPLDPAVASSEANARATNEIWAQWEGDERIDQGWDRKAAGEVECADGNLYMTLVLQRGSGWSFTPTSPFANVSRLTAGNGASRLGGVTSDGNVVAISSAATNLHATVPQSDVLLYDRVNATMRATGLGPADNARITADGTELLVGSAAADLFPHADDEPSYTSVFAADTRTGVVELLSPGTYTEVLLAEASSDGNVYVQVQAGQGGWWSLAERAATGYQPYPGYGMGPWGDDPTPRYALSGDGRYVGFAPGPTFTDRLTGQTVTPDGIAGCSPRGTALAPGGRFFAFDCTDQVAFAGDTDRVADLFLWDRQTRTTVRLTPGTDGLAALGPASIAVGGRYVAYAYERPGGGGATYLLDRSTNSSTLLAPVAATELRISADGNSVAFAAVAPDRPSGSFVTDVFLWRRPGT